MYVEPVAALLHKYRELFHNSHVFNIIRHLALHDTWQLIRYLIEQWGYDYSTLLSDESRDDFNYRYARSNAKAEGNAGLNQQTPARPTRPRRQADNSGTNQLCPTTRRFIMPKAAMNNQGNWMYVVNLNEVDDRYTQLVGTETCVSNRCNGICSLPNGYTSRCEQQYVQKRLVALEPSGNQLYTDVFWFPHCCVCQITQTG
ncbi:Protein spaetzle 5 [Gryllus bimaculatus]|nr:Protein spaetzle 5 [Gryllus bimaculatus]